VNRITNFVLLIWLSVSGVTASGQSARGRTSDLFPVVAPDERLAEAIDLVLSKRSGDGSWPLEARYPGKMPVETDEGEGRPSRWNTLRALRVLNWNAAGD
jgi:hypothetical protein